MKNKMIDVDHFSSAYKVFPAESLAHLHSFHQYFKYEAFSSGESCEIVNGELLEDLIPTREVLWL